MQNLEKYHYLLQKRVLWTIAIRVGKVSQMSVKNYYSVLYITQLVYKMRKHIIYLTVFFLNWRIS